MRPDSDRGRLTVLRGGATRWCSSKSDGTSAPQIVDHGWYQPLRRRRCVPVRRFCVGFCRRLRHHRTMPPPTTETPTPAATNAGPIYAEMSRLNRECDRSSCADGPNGTMTATSRYDRIVREVHDLLATEEGRARIIARREHAKKMADGLRRWTGELKRGRMRYRGAVFTIT